MKCLKTWALSFVVLLLCIGQLLKGAIPATAVWEIRAACQASALYGGFFVPGGGGVDGSQSDNPRTVYDGTTNAIATGGDWTTITCAGHPFDADDVNNGIRLSGGTNIIVGWYHIASQTEGTATLDRACATGDSTNGTGYLAGAVGFLDAVLDAAVPGHIYYVKADATYTLAESPNMAISGTAAAPIKIIGYNSSRATIPTGTDRPLIACGGYSFTYGMGYVQVSNLRGTGTATYVFGTGQTAPGCITRNCSVENSSGTANHKGIQVRYTDWLINCSVASTNGYAVYGESPGFYLGCYFHDSSVGWFGDYGAGSVLTGCVFDTCTTGFLGGAGTTGIIINLCTFYNGTTAINFPAVACRSCVTNCIISNYTTGITDSGGDATGALLLDYNNYYSCDTDVNNCVKGLNDYDLDPGFADAANADFRIGTNCKAKGFPGLVPGAATCRGYLDTGAVQRKEAGHSY